jgi:hypothetical protein
VIYFKAGSATTEGPGPDPQPTFTLNLLLFGIYFQRPAGSSPCFAPRRRAPSARVPHGGAHRALRGALIGWHGPQRYIHTNTSPARAREAIFHCLFEPLTPAGLVWVCILGSSKCPTTWRA